MSPLRNGFLIGSAGLLLGLSSLGWHTGSARTGGSCEGCHAMAPQHVSWRSGNHAKAARCEDCHLPQASLARKSETMAADGLRHAALTALGATPPVIRLHEAGAQVVQGNCVRCHPRAATRVTLGRDGSNAPRPLPQPATAAHADTTRACTECHRETSHARTIGG